MLVTVSERQVDFRPWRPANGLVLSDPYAFDCETTLIDKSQHWLPPAYVLGAASDGQQGYFVCREHVGEFFAVHRDVPVAIKIVSAEEKSDPTTSLISNEGFLLRL